MCSDIFDFSVALQFLSSLGISVKRGIFKKSYGRTMWDSLLRALVPLLPMDGDIAKATPSEARIGETHGELVMGFSGIYRGERPWRATACWSKYGWEIL